jgi:hypothetical protein
VVDLLRGTTYYLLLTTYYLLLTTYYLLLTTYYLPLTTYYNTTYLLRRDLLRGTANPRHVEAVEDRLVGRYLG